MSAPLLEVSDLSVALGPAPDAPRAVTGVSLQLAPGEILGLVGESGSGKTLTCRALARLLPGRRLRIASGRIVLDGIDITTLPEAELIRIRGSKIGMIFQNPSSHLDPCMTIGDQIAAPLRIHEGLSRRAARTRTAALLAEVGIPDPTQRLDAYPHEFSGGMRQRAMIAGALAREPKVLIADEPTTALDVTVQAQILKLLLEIRERSGLAIILVTHDLGVVGQVCDRVAVMYAGSVVESGTRDALLSRPLHPYTEGLLASQPEQGEPLTPLISIPGQPPALDTMPPGCRFHPRCRYADARCRTERPPLGEVGAGHQSACWHWRRLTGAAAA